MAIKIKSQSKRSNMYEFVTGMWNPVRGECNYKCSYCYVNNWGRAQKPIRLDKKELVTPLGSGQFIFICSGCDLFHPDVPIEWIKDIHAQTRLYKKNKYLWHTKNPYRLVSHIEPCANDYACITFESNRKYESITKAPPPVERMKWLREWEGKKMITVEPIMDFDMPIFAEMILHTSPIQVNIGADSGRNNLPEPSKEKVEALILQLLNCGYSGKIHLKNNLRRILPEHELYGE